MTHTAFHRQLTALRALGLICALSFGLSGCASVFIGTTAGSALLVAQERTVGNAVDDIAIQTQINEKLFAQDSLLFARVNLTVTEGNVVMTGSVPEADDKVTAARLAWQVSGVQSVNNELQVRDTSSLTDKARDTWITTQLRARMLADGDIYDINYTLDTVNGVIYVMGIARNQNELNRVLSIARTIQYAQRVVSLVRIANVQTPQ